MPRTKPDLVKRALGKNYDTTIDLDVCIATASILVDGVAAVAGEQGIAFDDARAELMERWLACDSYVQIDPTYTSRSDLGAAGSFSKQDFRGQAERLDPTGTLRNIDQGSPRATGIHLGRTRRDLKTYQERDT